ncbi:hypothetical protein Tco_0677112 [Tanacetum coccineum]
MNSENDNEKAIIPSFPPPEPTTSYLDDLDFLNDFENEFPAIVYNGAQTSKSDYLTEPTLSPQHIDESDLNDETSLSEYDEVEQNVLYLIDPFPLNIIRLDDLKSDEDNDNNRIDIVQSSGDMAPLPPRDVGEDLQLRDTPGSGCGLSEDARAYEGWGPLVWELILEFLIMLRFGEVMLDLDAPITIQFQLGGARRR